MNRTALMFAGQGAQVVGMGKDLVEQVPAARELFERANEALGYDLSKVCFEGPEADLTKTENAQPAIFLVGYLAYELLKERCPNLEFGAAAGLSLGEFTALAAAGVISFEDGLKLVRARGRFMQEACEATEGGMAAIIGLSEEDTREVCEAAGVQLANLNCPGQLVISGEKDALTKACEAAKEKGAKRALPLPVAGAYHSPLMASAQPKLKAELDQLTLATPSMPVVSNVTARPHADNISDLLVDQVTSSVRWEDSVRWLLAEGFNQFIELGPGTALTGFMRRIDRGIPVVNIADVASLEKTVETLNGE